ncbi:MAG TPA: exodeoxyribonuclease VII large subunit [Bacteroidales bacterium]|nr:exodeoxyribonuclease VII large subunit [Bacteroidales bacterium]
MSRDSLTISEINRQIRNVIKDNFPRTVWVVAEISEMKTNYQGHCYLELVEKGKDDRLIAKAQGNIWAYTFRILKPYFETTTGMEFTSGIKVMVNVSVEFHELYGYSLNIKDIDPAYTLGDLALRRMEIIKRLQDDGIFDLNKELEFPLVLQRIAIISSGTAAGYGDFMNQLENNVPGYVFHTRLFPAIVQGDKAESSIIHALEEIFQQEDSFDCVVIIRGGGSQSDLSCFDSYLLASHVAQFPVPVLTGIGHEKDETITDLVAHTSLKTPTAVAEFIISRVESFDLILDEFRDRLTDKVNQLLSDRRQQLTWISNNFAPVIRTIVAENKSRLAVAAGKANYVVNTFLVSKYHTITGRSQKLSSLVSQQLTSGKYNCSNLQSGFSHAVKNYLKNKHYHQDLLEKKSEWLDPGKLLKKGYSITFHKGKILKSESDIGEDEVIETRLYKGRISSKTMKKTEIK